MTTSAYIALVEPILTISELVASDLRAIMQIGNKLITFMPRADQKISPDHTIEGFADKLPANDNESEVQPEAQPEASQPAVAASKVPEAIVEKTREMPGVQRILHREALFNAKFGHINDQPANAPSPFKGHSRLKSMFNEIPVKESVPLTTRPAWENWIAHHPHGRPKTDIAA